MTRLWCSICKKYVNDIKHWAIYHRRAMMKKRPKQYRHHPRYYRDKFCAYTTPGERRRIRRQRSLERAARPVEREEEEEQPRQFIGFGGGGGNSPW